MLRAQMIGHSLVHLLDARRFGMRELEQATDAPGTGLDMPGGDRVAVEAGMSRAAVVR
jgi:hypothetical protein